MTGFSLAPPEGLARAVPAGLVFALEREQDAPLVEAMIDQAFGPGRFAKTAERLREGNRQRLDLSVCAWAGERMAGAARQWPILIGDTQALFLGPFAVESAYRSLGLGGALIAEADRLATEAGERLTLLVGDLAYFAPFGFQRVEPGRVLLPGPVDPRRILWRAHRPDGLDGVTGPARIPPRT